MEITHKLRDGRWTADFFSSLAVGPWQVHPVVMQQEGAYFYDATRWAVSLDGKLTRSGFTCREGAIRWAENSAPTDNVPSGDTLLSMSLGLKEVDPQVFVIIGFGGDWQYRKELPTRKYALSVMAWLAATLVKACPPKIAAGNRFIAINRVTGARRGGSVSTATLYRDSDAGVCFCTGPCKCRVEPDGHCPQGWPSRMMAAGVI